MHLARLARRQVLVLGPDREELLTQAREKACVLDGDAVVEIERGGLRRRRGEVLASTACCTRSGWRASRGAATWGSSSTTSATTWLAEDNLRVLREPWACPAAFDGTLLGFTATTARGDGQGLDEGVPGGRLHARPARADRRWLSGATARLPDLDDGGIPGAVAAGSTTTRRSWPRRSTSRSVTPWVAWSIEELARDRRTIRRVTVNHARHLAHALKRAGRAAGIVHGAMPGAARAQALRDFRERPMHVLTNVGVLTEGFDDPASCVAMARPTRRRACTPSVWAAGTRPPLPARSSA